MIISDVLENFLNGLDYRLFIEEINYDGTNTTFTLSKMLFLREKMNVLLDGQPQKINTTNYSQKTATLFGDFSYITEFKLIAPTFLHGTHYAINIELDRFAKSVTPIVCLNEIATEDIPTDVNSRFSTIPTLRIYFLDDRNKQWTTDEIYEYCIIQQREWVDYFVKNIYSKRGLFGLPTNIRIRSFSKFGEYQDLKGAIQSLYNKNLAGIELEITLPIVKNKCSI